RFAGGDPEQARVHAVQLVSTAPDVILAVGVRAAAALQPATRTVPIVVAQLPDPVELGFVTSLSRPRGHMPGFALFEVRIAVKWLELLKELAPRATRVAFIYDAINPSGRASLSALQRVASTFGVQLSGVIVQKPDEMAPAIEGFAREPNGGL